MKSPVERCVTAPPQMAYETTDKNRTEKGHFKYI